MREPVNGFQKRIAIVSRMQIQKINQKDLEIGRAFVILSNLSFWMDEVYSVPSPFKPVITLNKQAPNAIYAPADNEKSFLY